MIFKLAVLLSALLSLSTIYAAAEEPPRELINIIGKDPVLIGVIDRVTPSTELNDQKETGTVLLHVDEFLQRTGLALSCTAQCSVVYEFALNQDQVPPGGPTPSGWNRLHPAKGMRVLLILSRTEPPVAEAVLDLKNEQQFVPVVRQAISLQENTDRGDLSPAFQALANPSTFVRLVALESLRFSGACEPGSPNRKKLLAVIENQALHGSQDERKQALNWLDEALYDERSANNENNNEILSFLLTLTKDPDADVSLLATRLLYYRVSSDNKPDLRTVTVNNRGIIASGLRDKAADLKKRGGQNERLAEMAQIVANEMDHQ